MYKIDFGKSGLQVPAVAVGCMRIADMDAKMEEMQEIVKKYL